MFSDVMKELMEFVNEERGCWKEMMLECDVSESWLRKFSNGEIPNPGVITLDKIYQYMQENFE